MTSQQNDYLPLHGSPHQNEQNNLQPCHSPPQINSLAWLWLFAGWLLFHYPLHTWSVAVVWEIVEGAMVLNTAGKIVENCWCAIPGHFPQVTLDEFVVMPNHVHGIITVGANDYLPLRSNEIPRPLRQGTSRTIGSMVRGFKIGVTRGFVPIRIFIRSGSAIITSTSYATRTPI